MGVQIPLGAKFCDELQFMRQMVDKIISIALILAMATGCSSFGRHGLSSKAAVSAQDAEEISVGRQIHESIIAKMPVYEDAVVTGYIRQLGQSFVPHVKRQNLPYQFSVLSDDRIFATSAPGGYVYITTGFIEFLDNEAELASVLAHEMGELQRRDPKLSTSLKLLEKTIQGSAVVAPIFGSIGALAMLGLVGVHSLAANEPYKTSRLEKADDLALQYLSEAGYDPQGMINLYYKILEASPQELMYLFDYQQSRTVTWSRVANLEKLFKNLPSDRQIFNVNRERFLSMTQTLREHIPQSTT